MPRVTENWHPDMSTIVVHHRKDAYIITKALIAAGNEKSPELLEVIDRIIPGAETVDSIGVPVPLRFDRDLVPLVIGALLADVAVNYGPFKTNRHTKRVSSLIGEIVVAAPNVLNVAGVSRRPMQ